MAKKWTLAECFAHFGAVGKNPRWSWSARSLGGQTVVITLWEDHLTYGAGTVIYDEVERERRAGSIERPGNRERLENLMWARDHWCLPGGDHESQGRKGQPPRNRRLPSPGQADHAHHGS